MKPKKILSVTLILLLLISVLPISVFAWTGLDLEYRTTFDCSNRHAIAIGTDGRAYTWGSNAFGQTGFGLGTTAENPCPVTWISGTPVSVSVGDYTTAMVMADGTLYTCGYNVYGSCGLPKYTGTDFRVFDFTKVNLENVVDVSLGIWSGLALTADGSVYIWGVNSDDALDFVVGSQVDVIYEPVKIPYLSDIVDISCSDGVYLALDSKGNLYRWGFTEIHPGYYRETFDKPAVVACGVDSLSMGRMCLGIMYASGERTMEGYDEYYICQYNGGPISTEVEGSPEETLISDAFPGIASVATGNVNNIFLLMDDGSVYGFGDDMLHEMGIGKIEYDYGVSGASHMSASIYSINDPQKLTALSNITAISCAENFNLALDSSGALYAWGRDYNVISPTDTECISTPRAVMYDVAQPGARIGLPLKPADNSSLGNFVLSNYEVYAKAYADVDSSSWYGADKQGIVPRVSAYGIMRGKNHSFNPNGTLTVAQAIKMVAVCHNIYAGGAGTFQQGNPWYQIYADYTLSEGIMQKGQFSDDSRPITREEMASLFARALPKDEFTAVNSGVPADAVVGSQNYDSLLTLYRAGVMCGDGQGNVKPNEKITRAEAAAIIVRVIEPTSRLVLS